MKKYLCMSKNVFLLTFIILLALSASGCGKNEIELYIGTSTNAENNVLLKQNKDTLIKQTKEKIENSKLVFKLNGRKTYDNLYICYKGNNIKNIKVGSDKKTVYYTKYNKVSRGLEYISFYYKPDKSVVKEDFDPYRDMELRWDNGQFDDIRNVYFNGMSMFDITRERKDSNKETGTVNSNLYKSGEISDIYYLEAKGDTKDTVIYTDILLSTANNKLLPQNDDDIIIQNKTVKASPNVDEDFFLYRYEKLFYNSQQKALRTKNTFDYSDIENDTVKITVNYKDKTEEKYKIKISFDKNGNIIAKQELLK